MAIPLPRYATLRAVKSIFDNLLILNLVLRLLSRIMYKVGPRPEPWTMLLLITAGVYSPAEVLVVWFLPDRNEIMEIIRKSSK